MTQKRAPLYKPYVISLRWPIERDNGEGLKKLTLNLISHGDHAAVLDDDPDEREAFAEFARLSCGLSAQEVSRLKAPDWNALRLKLSDLVAKPSGHFLKDAGKKFNKDVPVLLKPIAGDDGQEIAEVELEVPSVATIDLMDKQINALARSNFLTMSCTSLSLNELNQLSCPDWNALQGQLNDFLNESADFFQ